MFTLSLIIGNRPSIRFAKASSLTLMYVSDTVFNLLS